jgi:branched-chain amino acid transport system substrate-binding protein
MAKEEYDKKDSVSFIFEDDQMEPKNTVTAFNKLTGQDHIQGLVVWGSPNSLAVNELAERAQLPMIGISMLDKVVENKKFVVKHWIPIRPLTELIHKEVGRRGYKSTAVVTVVNDATLKQRDLFVQSGITNVAFSEEVTKGENDFRSLVTRIKQSQAESVYLLVWQPQVSLIAKQLREAGYKGNFFGIQSLEDQHEVTASQGALNGTWFAGHDDSNAGQYYVDFEKRYGSRPAAGGTNAYDIAHILINGASATNLNDYLHSIQNFTGVLGMYGITTNNDFSFRPKLKCIRDGVIVVSGCE